MSRKTIITFLLATSSLFVWSQSNTLLLSFKHIAKAMKTEWYASDDAKVIADTVLKYQFPSGGWAKNQEWQKELKKYEIAERMEIWKQLKSDDGVGSTIDNGATTTEMLFLANMYVATGEKKYRKAFLKGLQFLLDAQYDNGGWPQYYPFKPLNDEGHPFYSNHITFNDNAMYNVLMLLRNVYEGNAPYQTMKLSEKELEKLKVAFDKGIECILNCQIKKDGKLTVWCQQHDENTLLPTTARAYELASFTGSHETPALLELLMSLPEPNDRVIESVSAAVEWLKSHTIKDMTVSTFTNERGTRDRRLVHKFGHDVWARYYDLNTEEPFVCGRDGKPQPSLEYIGYERRNGYGWYGTQPQDIIDAFPQWIEKVRKNINK